MTRTYLRSNPTQIPCLALLQRCSSMDELKQFHAHTITHGLARFSFIASKLLAFSALSNCPNLRYSETLLGQNSNPDVFDFNSIIMGFSRTSKKEKGFSAFAKMRSVDIEPNAHTFVALIRACFGLGLVRQVHDQIIKLGHESDVFVVTSLVTSYSGFGAMGFAQRVFDEKLDKNVVCWTSLLSGYCLNGLVDEARELFNEMPVRNDVSYSAMVSGYVSNGRYDEAIRLFRELKMTCCNADLKGSLLVSVLNTCGSVGAVDEGEWIRSFLDWNGLVYELELGTALIDFYSKCGFVSEAYEIFIQMPRKDVKTWSAMIAGLAINGKNNLGLKIFAEMETNGPKPNAVTFIGVLTACNHEYLVDKAWGFLGRMSKVYGIFPLIEHYGCLVDLLARSGRLKEAEILIRTMPMEPDRAIWGSLLNGCILHGHVELGEIVGKLLIQLELAHSGRYVLLANMYAKMGKWKDVMRVRKMMKERDVAVFSAWSFVEIGSVVHKFIGGDRSHPQWRNVYGVLEQLKRVIDESSSIGNIEVCLI